MDLTAKEPKPVKPGKNTTEINYFKAARHRMTRDEQLEYIGRLNQMVVRDAARMAEGMTQAFQDTTRAVNEFADACGKVDWREVFEQR